MLRLSTSPGLKQTYLTAEREVGPSAGLGADTGYSTAGSSGSRPGKMKRVIFMLNITI